MGTQLPLGIGLPDGAVFATFHPGPNAAAAAAAAGTEPVLYLYGEAGAGKSHLLQAACAHAGAEGRRAALLPLAQRRGIVPAMIEGWEQFDLVCVDDIGAIAGDADWEHALFALFNALRAQGGRWIAAGADAPVALGLALPDLASRLAAGPTLRLHALDDAGRVAALGLRARQRGFDLPDEVARYLLKHAPRDMGTLYAVLERLDAASLAQQRRVTVQLLKSVISP